VRIPAGSLAQLQTNLVRSHAGGVGQPLSEGESRAMLLLRANVLAKGFSGCRPELVELLVAMLNAGVHPVIPGKGLGGRERRSGAAGSPGAGGHRRGRGVLQRRAHGRRRGAAAGRVATAGAGGQRGAGAAEWNAGHDCRGRAGSGARLARGQVGGCGRGHGAGGAHGNAGGLRCAHSRGAASCGANRRGRPFAPLLEGSEIREAHREHDSRVQDAYCLRCMPQVHGAVRDVLDHVRAVLEIESGSATDNPLVFRASNWRSRRNGSRSFRGNFHGAPLAYAFDYAAIALTDLAGITERRIDRLLNPDINEGLPAFLSPDPGLSSGFMMAQIVAAALINECQVLAHPSSTGSIPTSGGKEDHVSMGMTGALKLRQIVEHAERIVALS
jgi:histidine ammonia-lyase